MITESRFWMVASMALVAMAVAAALNPLTLAAAIPACGLCLIPLYRLTFQHWPAFDLPLLVWFLAIAGLGGLSSIWSVTPEASAARAFKIAGLLLPALPLLAVARQFPQAAVITIGRALPIILIILAAILAIEHGFDFPIYRTIAHIPKDQPLSTSNMSKYMAFLILSLPAAFFFLKNSGRKIEAVILAVLVLVDLVLTQSQAAQLSAVVMPLAFIGVVFFPRLAPALTFIGAGVVMATMPWLAPYLFLHFGDSARHGDALVRAASSSERLEVYNFVSHKIWEDPLIGFGMDCTRSITDFVSEKKYFPSSTIMHPHNIGLQLWIEFGIFGVGLGIGFLAFLTCRLMKFSGGVHHVMFATLCGALVFLMVSWSLWASWLISLLLYLGVLSLLLVTFAKSQGSATPKLAE